MAADYDMREKTNLIPLISDAIYTSDTDLMLKYLNEVISPTDEPKIQLAWMDIFISNMYEFNEKDMLDPFFEKLDDINFTASLKSISFYIMKGNIPKEILQFLGDNLKNESYKTIIQDISVFDESEYTRQGCINAEIMYGKQPREVNEFLQYFNEEDPNGVNMKVREVLRENLDRTERNRGVPKWIGKTDKKKTPLYYTNVFLPSPNKINEIFNSLIEDGIINENEILSGISEKSIVKVNNVFVAQYSILTLIEKVNLFNSLVKLSEGKYLEGFSSFVDEENFKTDLEMFNRWGPVNTTFEQNIDSEDTSDVCIVHGGCRMLTCLCNKAVEEESYDIDDEDWFTGKCEKCNRKIGSRKLSFKQRKRCALREPLAYGSWRGCFCSFRCIRMSIDDRYEDDGEESTKDIQRVLLITMEIQIKSIGIYE